MMQHDQTPLSQAIARAEAQAEVRRLEISRTTDSGRTAQLLAAQAENLRLSPLGADQLLAMALETAASPTEVRAPGLDALREPPAPLAQIQLRNDVLLRYDAAMGRAVAKAAPDWVLRRCRSLAKHDPETLPSELRTEAALNAALWDHPALPASAQLRGLMLACVAPLRDRAARIARGSQGRSPPRAAEPLLRAAWLPERNPRARASGIGVEPLRLPKMDVGEPPALRRHGLRAGRPVDPSLTAI